LIREKEAVDFANDDGELFGERLANVVFRWIDMVRRFGLGEKQTIMLGHGRADREGVFRRGSMARLHGEVEQAAVPGFVDTHNHAYQGLLRSTLSNGLLNPDYNRDVQTTLTPAYQAADAYAGVLVSALGMIDMGTTGIVEISQVSHTPEHSDACIRALQEAGIRAVFSYHRGAGPGAQYPQDIRRLQRTYFSSKDQLLTLALFGLGRTASRASLARGSSSRTPVRHCTEPPAAQTHANSNCG
jgi:hypothetical protein